MRWAMPSGWRSARGWKLSAGVNRGLMYRFVGELVEPPDGPADPDLPAGTVMGKLLWQRLRITPGEVRRRLGVAARIRPRRSLTGAVLAPELPHLASAVDNGDVGEEHIGAVCHALDVLPSAVSCDQREKAERILVRHAVCQDATFVTVIGRRIADHLNPDGLFDEHDRARRRGLHPAPQGPDGMSRLSGWLDPETRAYLEAVNAAVRPGRHQPDGDVPDEADPDPRSGPNGCTTPSSSASKPASPPASSAGIAGCRSPSSSPRHCASWTAQLMR